MVKELCKVRLSFIFILTSQLIITFLATAIEVMVRITYRPHFFQALFLVLLLVVFITTKIVFIFISKPAVHL